MKEGGAKLQGLRPLAPDPPLIQTSPLMQRGSPMTDIRGVNAKFAVAPQLQPADFATLSGRYAAVINNRPNGEEPGQPTESALAAAAEAAGLAYVHIPVAGAPTLEQVRAMQAAIADADGPVLAFCRTGTRSIVTWALGQALDGRPVEALSAEGAAAGYDLEPPLRTLLPRMAG
jgi:uncharacterized protein (TIGR01244 family)